MKKSVKTIISVTAAMSMLAGFPAAVYAEEEKDYSILEGKTISFMTSQANFLMLIRQWLMRSNKITAVK